MPSIIDRCCAVTIDTIAMLARCCCAIMLLRREMRHTPMFRRRRMPIYWRLLSRRFAPRDFVTIRE